MKRIRALAATIASVGLLAALSSPMVMTASAKTARPGHSAHAAALCLRIATPTPGTVLWIRTGPGSNYRAIGYLTYGDQILYPCGLWPWLYNEGPYGPYGWVNGYYTAP